MNKQEILRKFKDFLENTEQTDEQFELRMKWERKHHTLNDEFVHDIVAQFGSSYPYYGPYACDQLVYGGYSDWYLPSLFEMIAIRQNAFAINLAIQALGSGNEIDINNFYWTSTFTSSNSAFVVGGFYYITFPATITNQNYVRAIRKF